MQNPITFNVRLNDDSKGKNRLIIKGDYASVLKLEGLVEIFINKRLWFTDPYFPVLEFLIKTVEWKADLLKRDIHDLFYQSLESEEYPILAFNNSDDRWTVFSVWSEYKEDTLFSLQDVITCIEEFENQLRKELRVRKIAVTFEN